MNLKGEWAGHVVLNYGADAAMTHTSQCVSATSKQTAMDAWEKFIPPFYYSSYIKQNRARARALQCRSPIRMHGISFAKMGQHPRVRSRGGGGGGGGGLKPPPPLPQCNIIHIGQVQALHALSDQSSIFLVSDLL